MFSEYTEKARRVIFFARYEASDARSPVVDLEHLLLGLLREDKSLFLVLLGSSFDVTMKAIDTKVRHVMPKKDEPANRVELPMSQASKEVLGTAYEFLQKFGGTTLKNKHLLYAILMNKEHFVYKILSDHGVTEEKVLPLLYGNLC